MKKVFITLTVFFILALGACETVPAQGPHIWKYSAPNTPRTNYDAGVFTYYTADADTLTSMAFGPGTRFTWNSWNGLSGISLQVDSVSTASYSTPDTFFFRLIHDRGVGTVTRPGKLLWTNTADSTETDTFIIIPADHGKIWQWHCKPSTQYLDKFPDNKYYLELWNLHADSALIEQEYFAY